MKFYSFSFKLICLINILLSIYYLYQFGYRIVNNSYEINQARSLHGMENTTDILPPIIILLFILMLFLYYKKKH